MKWFIIGIDDDLTNNRVDIVGSYETEQEANLAIEDKPKTSNYKYMVFQGEIST